MGAEERTGERELVLARAAELVRRRDFAGAEALLQPLVEDEGTADGGRSLLLYAEAAFYGALHRGGEFGRVERLINSAMRAPRASPELRARSLNGLGVVAYAREQYGEAVALYREGLQQAPLSPETRLIRVRLGGNLAEALRSMDDPEAAHVEYLKAMELLDEADDRYVQGALLLGTAAVDHDRRHDDVAIRRALRAQALFSQVDDPFAFQQATLLAAYYLITGEMLEPASKMVYSSVDAAGDDPSVARFLVRYDLAVLSYQRQAYTEAESLARAAHQEARARGSQRFGVLSASLSAEIAEALGDDATAVSCWVEAGDQAEQLGLGHRAGQIWQRLGMLYSRQGDLQRSQRYIRRALECLRDQQSAPQSGARAR
jgi:tetratricopeptide (TPR) repeat protein